MNRVFSVRFMDGNGQIRSFIESADNLDLATEQVCDKLQDHIANAKKDLMHYETVEVVG